MLRLDRNNHLRQPEPANALDSSFTKTLHEQDNFLNTLLSPAASDFLQEDGAAVITECRHPLETQDCPDPALGLADAIIGTEACGRSRSDWHLGNATGHDSR
jgi:hypothetical protein